MAKSLKVVKKDTYYLLTYINKHNVSYKIKVDYEHLALLINNNFYIDKDINKNTSYIKIQINKKYVRFHRFIMNLLNSNHVVDHINGNGLDNRISNLRIATNQLNRFNSKKPNCKFNTSIYKGVQKRHNKWIARIGFNNKRLFLGYFSSEKEAAIAYNNKALELFGKFAQINEVL